VPCRAGATGRLHRLNPLGAFHGLTGQVLAVRALAPLAPVQDSIGFCALASTEPASPAAARA
jgi:hypothetical protein